jgi:hypothetical protein
LRRDDLIGPKSLARVYEGCKDFGGFPAFTYIKVLVLISASLGEEPTLHRRGQRIVYTERHRFLLPKANKMPGEV